MPLSLESIGGGTITIEVVGDGQTIAIAAGVASSGGGGASALDGLSDVTITTPASGEVLKYDGSGWVNGAVAGSGTVTSVGLSVPTGLAVTGSPITSSGTLAITTALSGLIKGTGSGFAAAVAGTDYLADITGETLSDLSDVTITSIASGEVLAWSGSAWINNTLAEAGIAAASHVHAASDITSGTLAVARGGTGAGTLPVVSNYTGGATVSAYLSGIDTALAAKLAASAVSSYGLTLIDDADAATARTTLGAAKASADVVSKGGYWESPATDDLFVLFFTPVAITVSKIVAVLVGSGSITYTVRHDPDASATGNEIVTGGSTVTSSTTGGVVTTFNDATIPANSWVWVKLTAVSGTVDGMNITIEHSKDA